VDINSWHIDMPDRYGNTNEFAADIISTVEFDQTGNYLATGDKGGRVVLFERNETVSLSVYMNQLM
jgi:hypothetical protein